MSQNLNQQQTPPRAQKSKDIDLQKASPSRANTQPPSPSRISSQPRNTTKSPSQNSSQSRSPTHQSPSHLPKKAQPITQIPSPPRVNSQTRLAPQTPSPSRTLPDKKQKSQKTPKSEISPTLAPQSNEPFNHPSTSQISYENKRNEDKEKQITLVEKSEENIKGEELTQEPKIVTQISDTHVTDLLGLKESILSDKNLASDEESKQEEEDQVVSIKDTLDPTISTKEQAKTIISDVANKDQYHDIPHHKGINDEISKFVHKITNEHQRHPLDENQISVITLTGENRGAAMSLDYESGQRDRKISIRRDYKVNSQASTDSTSEGENSSSKKSSDEEPTAYINSNIQSINNSIMFNSSTTDMNPGVHFSMSHTVMERDDEDKSTEKIEDYKTKFNVAQSQKLSYKPIVRRRCLKGLFMESSDSDPSNPDKPRRHGCRYVCREKSGEDLL